MVVSMLAGDGRGRSDIGMLDMLMLDGY